MGVLYRAVSVLGACATVTAMAIVSPAVAGAATPSTAPTAATVAAAAAGTTDITNPVPATDTPAVDDGDVRAILEMGDTMVIGGNFTSVAGQPRSRLAAFNANTGKLTALNLPADATVWALAKGPTPDTVYVGGDFKNIGGVAKTNIALVDISTNTVVPGFTTTGWSWGGVRGLEVVEGRVVAVGLFTKAGGQPHAGIAAFNGQTGKSDHTFVNIQFSGRVNDNNGGTKGTFGATGISATPDKSQLVVIGNFRLADSLTRTQVAVLNTSPTGITVRPDWKTARYEVGCNIRSFDAYVRGVDISPDGSYFVVASTGGTGQDKLCDAAARFNLTSTGTDIQPTWVSETGGDTTWGVGITDGVVYVGGHQRWANNPYGSDTARPGAVPRPGLMALQPDNGRPLSWNPGRNPPGIAVFTIEPTSRGIYIGSNTDWIGNRQYWRPKLAHFSNVGGWNYPATNVGTLPGTVIQGGTRSGWFTSGSDALNSSQLTTSGTAESAVGFPNGGGDWSEARGAFMVGDTVFYISADRYLHKRTLVDGTWGEDQVVNPYNDPLWRNVDNNLNGTFNGSVPSLYGQADQVQAMFYDNGRLYYVRSGSLYYRLFSVESGIMDERVFSVSSSVSMSSARGAFVHDGSLYYGWTDGRLRKVAWVNGQPSGASTVVSGPGYDRGSYGTTNIMFLVAGPPPNAVPTAAATATCTIDSCTFDGSASADTDGTIASYAWDFGDGTTATGPTASHTYADAGTYTATLTVTDDRGGSATTTTQATAVANQAPVVAFSASCAGTVCAVDASGTTDDTGIASYAWEFGDGATATGVNGSHTYADSGSYTVTLTVTDDRGLTSTSTQQVEVTKPTTSVQFVGAAHSVAKSSKVKSATVPADTAVGDLMLMVFSRPTASGFVPPAVLSTWTQAETFANGSMTTTVWSKTATAEDLGTSIEWTDTAYRLGNLELVVYRGGDASTVRAVASGDVSAMSHKAPDIQVEAGDFVVTYWAALAPAVDSWVLPAHVVRRDEVLDVSGSYRYEALVADAGTVAAAAGVQVGVTATSALKADRSVAWSIAFAQAPVVPAPEEPVTEEPVTEEPTQPGPAPEEPAAPAAPAATPQEPAAQEATAEQPQG